MSSSIKFGFRPRALDVTKKLPIRIRKCRKRSPKVKRTVAVAPSGMEKEEEMESHLQQAILAQKATSAGDTVENHVIPTPRVSTINDDEYDRIYRDRFLPKGKRLITFEDYVPFFLTQGSYNADSEDEEWLNARRTIAVEDFEHIIERLEIASQTDIIHPRNARALLQQFDPGLVDDVYDYWLQKRKQAASRKSRCSVLMPRLCTDHQRRGDEKALSAAVNPYTAFRRRLDKVQTRKKQRAELMTYERLLQINLAMRRSIVLASTIVQRERLKLALVDIEQSLYRLQLRKRMDNAEVDELRRRVVAGSAPSMDAMSTTPSTSSSSTATFFDQSSIPSSKCIQRNVELWNAASVVSPLVAVVPPSASDDSAELEKISAVDRNSVVDGRYQFRRKHGCRYRAPIAPVATTPTTNNTKLLNNNNNNDLIKQQKQLTLPPLPFSHSSHLDELDNPFRHFSTRFTQQLDPDTNPSAARSTLSGFVRRRMGRGGRVLIDLVRLAPSPSPPSPLEHTN